MSIRRRTPLVILFFLSGFSGLVYESVWTHLLRLFLGSAAYAQAAVLAIFMGGMAIGAALVGRRSETFANPLRMYALVEAVLGTFSLVFPWLFDAAVALSFDTVMPVLASPVAASAWKWFVASALILPPSILLGTTFPLMAAAVVRIWPDRRGESIAMMYFTNSLGGVVGALTSGFVLILFLGLSWTVRVAAIANIFVAVGAYVISRSSLFAREACGSVNDNREAVAPQRFDSTTRVVLLVALLTGTASFLYELSWIRMLSMVLGSSTHSFEVMLASFILGLALGGLWISRRIDRLASPIQTLGTVQVAMGLCAVATLFLYSPAFHTIAFAMERLDRTVAGYAGFVAVGFGIALAMMLPATICAGMTLPLATRALLGAGKGERAIGAVYAANTVGAVAGILAGIHFGFPLLGTKGMVVAGAVVDIGAGILLLALVGDGERRARFVRAGSVGVVALTVLVAVWRFASFDHRLMVSSIFRNGTVPQKEWALSARFLADGKSATIGVVEVPHVLALQTNGKSEGQISMDDAEGDDEPTMTMLAALPLSLLPDARAVAVVGFGLGTTTHTLLLSPTIERVDTVEIEAKVLEASRLFYPRNARAYDDPRSSVHIDDARNFFSSGVAGKYDIIVSEPSNPWVSGVGGLFSVEFYRTVQGRLSPGGVFAQWMHLYEIDVDLVVSVLKAIDLNFDRWDVYAASDVDIVIVARNGGEVGVPDSGVLSRSDLARELSRQGFPNPRDFRLRKIGNDRSFAQFVADPTVSTNTDDRPVLDQKGSIARFLNDSATVLVSQARIPLPVDEVFSLSTGSEVGSDRTTSFPLLKFLQLAEWAEGVRDRGILGEEGAGRVLPVRLRDEVDLLRRLFNGGQGVIAQEIAIHAVYDIGSLVGSFLPPEETTAFWTSLEGAGGMTMFPPELTEWISLMKAVGARDAVAMTRRARMIVERFPPRSVASFEYAVAAGALGARASKDESSFAFFAPFLNDDKIAITPEIRFLRRMLASKQ